MRFQSVLSTLLGGIAASGTTSAQVQTQEFQATTPRAGAIFGSSCDIDGPYGVVAAIHDPLAGINSGTLHFFEKIGGVWTSTTADLVAAPSAPGFYFGRDVDLDAIHDRAIAGAEGHPANGNAAGAAYILERDPVTGQWAVGQVLLPPGSTWAPNDSDNVGTSVLLMGDWAFAGGMEDDHEGNAISNAGAVHVFHRDPLLNTWQWFQKLYASDAAPDCAFGGGLSEFGGKLLVGAQRANTPGAAHAGKVYEFEFDLGLQKWVEVSSFSAADASLDDFFGRTIASNETCVFVGAYGDDDHGSRSGSVYVFERHGNDWIEVGKLTAGDGGIEDFFGFELDADIGHLVVGSPFDDTGAGVDSGSAYHFVDSPCGWILNAKIVPTDAAPFDAYGINVAVDQNGCWVGASHHEHTGTPVNSGAIYAYDLTAPVTSCGLATWANYGTGCSGSSGPLTLSLSSAPTIGGTLSLEFANPMIASNQSLIIVGFQAACIPRLGCAAYTLPSIGVFLPVSSASVPLTIPNTAELCNFKFFAQVISASTGTPSGYAFSPGLVGIIGN